MKRLTSLFELRLGRWFLSINSILSKMARRYMVGYDRGKVAFAWLGAEYLNKIKHCKYKLSSGVPVPLTLSLR